MTYLMPSLPLYLTYRFNSLSLPITVFYYLLYVSMYVSLLETNTYLLEICRSILVSESFIFSLVSHNPISAMAPNFLRYPAYFTAYRPPYTVISRRFFQKAQNHSGDYLTQFYMSDELAPHRNLYWKVCLAENSRHPLSEEQVVS